MVTVSVRCQMGINLPLPTADNLTIYAMHIGVATLKYKSNYWFSL